MHTRSESSSQHLTPVNCANLDALVLEYLAGEGLIEDNDANDENNQLKGRQAASAAYKQLYEGNIKTAVAIVSKYCPAVLQDHRLTFKLKRQQFIELLRQATASGDAAALACARDELAPLALDAYPEAYLDFKKAMLMLVQPHDYQQQQPTTQPQPQSLQQQQQEEEGWSLETRHRLAEVVYHTMLHEIGWSGPQLTQQLVYLLHLFSLYTSGSHGSSRGSSSGHTAQIQQLLSTPEAALVDGLLLAGRDEGPLPPDVSSQGYAERDVQALMSAVSLPRAAAVNALKAAAGDVAAALRHELMRFRINQQQLDLVAWEYAAARNLLEPLEVPSAAAATATAQTATAEAEAAAAADMDVDVDSTPPATAVAAAGSSKLTKRSKAAVCATDGPVGIITHMAAAGSSGRSSSPFEATAAAAVAAPAQQTAPEAHSKGTGAVGSAAAAAVDGSLLRSDSQSPPYKVPRWRSKQNPSRFCGQQPSSIEAAGVATTCDLQQVVVCSDEGQLKHSSIKTGNPSTSQSQQQRQLSSSSSNDAQPLHNIVQQVRDEQQQQRWQQLQQQLKSQAAASGAAPRQMEVQQSLQRLQGLVNQGDYQEVEELLEETQPGLLQEYPAVRFSIKRLQFVKLVQGNEFPGALQLVREQLTPLADKHPELLPSLKASMALLLPGRSSSTGAPDTDEQAAFLAMLLPLLQVRLGVEAPMAVKLVRVLLTGHKGWFKVQRCQDPFIEVLGLDKLLQCESSSAAAAMGAGRYGTAAASRQQQQQGAVDAGVGEGAGRAAARSGSTAAAFAAAARQALLEDPLDLNGDVHMDIEDDVGPDFDEGAVLQVMEVLELPRAAALELLAEHGGDAQAAIMQVFG